jgi:hypothetical protein
MEQKCKKILDPWSSLIDEISFEKDYFISYASSITQYYLLSLLK